MSMLLTQRPLASSHKGSLPYRADPSFHHTPAVHIANDLLGVTEHEQVELFERKKEFNFAARQKLLEKTYGGSVFKKAGLPMGHLIKNAYLRDNKGSPQGFFSKEELETIESRLDGGLRASHLKTQDLFLAFPDLIHVLLSDYFNGEKKPDALERAFLSKLKASCQPGEVVIGLSNDYFGGHPTHNSLLKEYGIEILSAGQLQEPLRSKSHLERREDGVYVVSGEKAAKIASVINLDPDVVLQKARFTTLERILDEKRRSLVRIAQQLKNVDMTSLEIKALCDKVDKIGILLHQDENACYQHKKIASYIEDHHLDITPAIDAAKPSGFLAALLEFGVVISTMPGDDLRENHSLYRGLFALLSAS